MSEEIDWSLTTFEGNRRRQHEEFLALPLREKLLIIEQTEELAALLAARRAAREAAKGESEPRSVRQRDSEPRSVRKWDSEPRSVSKRDTRARSKGDP